MYYLLFFDFGSTESLGNICYSRRIENFSRSRSALHCFTERVNLNQHILFFVKSNWYLWLYPDDISCAKLKKKLFKKLRTYKKQNIQQMVPVVLSTCGHTLTINRNMINIFWIYCLMLINMYHSFIQNLINITDIKFLYSIKKIITALIWDTNGQRFILYAYICTWLLFDNLKNLTLRSKFRSFNNTFIK